MRPKSSGHHNEWLPECLLPDGLRLRRHAEGPGHRDLPQPGRQPRRAHPLPPGEGRLDISQRRLHLRVRAVPGGEHDAAPAGARLEGRRRGAAPAASVRAPADRDRGVQVRLARRDAPRAHAQRIVLPRRAGAYASVPRPDDPATVPGPLLGAAGARAQRGAGRRRSRARGRRPGEARA